MDSKRKRADVLLVERGLFESRARAQAAIEAGLVTADGKIVAKASEGISENAEIDAQPAHPWVSRGGVKLSGALERYPIDIENHVCLDVGASTGGFTEVLLANGAALVFAIDVGRDQLHPSLRGHPRIVSMEETDIRSFGSDPLRHRQRAPLPPLGGAGSGVGRILDDTPSPGSAFGRSTLSHKGRGNAEHSHRKSVQPDQAQLSKRLPQRPNVVVIDCSFISLKAVLPAALELAASPMSLIALIKPQFEATRKAAKKGIVRDADVHQAVCDDIVAFATTLGCRDIDVFPSPIAGGDGNIEFFIGARRG